jgi:hypothetical protein
VKYQESQRSLKESESQVVLLEQCIRGLKEEVEILHAVRERGGRGPPRNFCALLWNVEKFNT